MCALQLKWCAWIAVYCSFISFANSRSSEDTKQMMSSFIRHRCHIITGCLIFIIFSGHFHSSTAFQR
ncbi:hypothetical protein CRUP_009094, partial [Coryphaenoides rupestris]